ncbi:hypothetical protein PTSG_07707 [Salpingoeca rosetta]|uniref:SH2 domain-containing protein n=1 Tax=Salpingoeca rosetta (strain ATCC 50818 / BSB-021) TaxID=946362 RepID=F2UHJ1_SALR5|nr:uncharacterized protein PTSG_07707 [Salpingoeca rosetta]EGD76590.1 hypothetical protein PTSG_07707 [Salpingoeca rosetta]|eukprot:XP_004991504.1 hypothetical protein PTSG_07707 [Salpingoeca rosetta]
MASGNGGGQEPAWYRGPFLKLTATASLIWTLGVTVVIAVVRTALLASDALPASYISVAAAVVGSTALVFYHRANSQATPPSARSRYQRYIEPLLLRSTLVLFALHMLVCLASTSNTNLSKSSAQHTPNGTDNDSSRAVIITVYDEAVLRVFVAITTAALLTLDHIYSSKALLRYPAQQGALILRIKTSVRAALERAHDLALHIVFLTAIGHFVVAELCGNAYEQVLSLLLNPMQHDHTHIHIEESKTAHVRRLTMSLLLTSLRQHQSFAAEYFKVDAGGNSQWRVVSASCSRILRQFITAISPGALTGLQSAAAGSLSSSSSTAAAAATNGRKPGPRVMGGGDDDVPSIPSTGPMTALQRRVTVLDRLLLWLKRVHLHLRLERAWFQPYITQQDAAYLLQGQRDGMFVVHASDTPGHLALTVTHDPVGSPKRHSGHTWTGYIVASDNKYALHGRETVHNFFSIEEMVAYYSKHPYNTNFAGEKLKLAPYHEERVVRAAVRAIVTAVTTTGRKFLMRVPGIAHLLRTPSTDALHTQLVGADGVCAALEILACSLEHAAALDKHTRARASAELGEWVALLSRLFLTVTHLEQPLRTDDRSTVDHANHRRVRFCPGWS